MVRHKENIQFVTVKENDLPDNRHEHVLKDEIIELTGVLSKDKYPRKLRRVAIWDEENQQVIEVITNQMSWTANTISELYKSRWQVEIFFYGKQKIMQSGIIKFTHYQCINRITLQYHFA